MSLDAAFRSKLRKALREHEGALEYFYKDSVGQVTIGVGHLVRHETDMVGLQLSRRKDGKPATYAEIVAAFRAVEKEPYRHVGKTDKKMHVWRATHYQGLSGANDIFMPEQEIDRLLDRHIDNFYDQLRRIYTVRNGYMREFDDFPENIRLALFDMIFNLGATKFQSGWPSFTASMKAEDWKEAAKQSRRPQLAPSRNQYVHDLLLLGDKLQPSLRRS